MKETLIKMIIAMQDYIIGSNSVLNKWKLEQLTLEQLWKLHHAYLEIFKEHKPQATEYKTPNDL